MHLHHLQLHQDMAKRVPAPEITTENGVVMSVVYVTAPPVFTGVLGDPSATQEEEETTPVRTTSPTRSAVSRPTAESSPDSDTEVAATSASRSYRTSSTITQPTAGYTATARTMTDHAVNTAAADATATDRSLSSTSTGSEMSTGAQAGIAIGVIAAIGVVLALILFCLGKKRKQRKQQAQLEEEKKASGGVVTTEKAASSTPNAPRLSLRPVSRLVPDLMGGGRPKSRLSQGNMLTTFHESSNGQTSQHLSPASATQHMVVTKPRPQENPFQDPVNPFTDPEKATAKSPGPVELPVTAGNPSRQVIQDVPSAAAIAAARAASRVAAPPVQAPVSPITPDMSQTSSPLLASIPPAVVAAPQQAPSTVGSGSELPGNVYRIMMDFKPTMNDELGLRAGGHVRLLHEYDDGWALCIRLDRSQQGVVPRTCLAAKPSKPRPGPGPGPGPRGPPPMNGQGSPPRSRPMTPNGQSHMNHSNMPQNAGNPRMVEASPRNQGPHGSRPISPGAFNQPPRPLSPGPRPQLPVQKRSMSPGPYVAGGPVPMVDGLQRRRSNSVNTAHLRDQRHTPSGPSQLGPGATPVRSASPGVAF